MPPPPPPEESLKLLYGALKTINVKPDFEAVATFMGLGTVTVEKRYRTLIGKLGKEYGDVLGGHPATPAGKKRSRGPGTNHKSTPGNQDEIDTEDELDDAAQPQAKKTKTLNQSGGSNNNSRATILQENDRVNIEDIEGVPEDAKSEVV